MNKPSISTIIVIVCLLIIGLYAMGEVNYFSSKIVMEKNVESPEIIIPSIGVDEKINNISLDYGVLSDPGDSIPTENPVVLYGHRTLQGSPFLRLNELGIGDTFLIEWPGVGELNYTVEDTKIVPAEYEFEQTGANATYLITCDPIGSTENRIIVQGELIDKNPINKEIIKNKMEYNQEKRERKQKQKVPIWEKSNLTLDEAAAYSGIGKNKLRELSDDIFSMTSS